jgi:BMFP domain-containing protein YqiC
MSASWPTRSSSAAPPQVVAETRERLAAAQARKADIEARLKELN